MPMLKKLRNNRMTIKKVNQCLLILCVALSVSGCSIAEKGTIKENATHIIVNKSKRELLLLKNQKVLKKYKISLGEDPLESKRCKGDGKTPEGKYRIDSKNPKSKYYLSLHISYPNNKDRELSKKGECDPGGDIVIHGIKEGLGFLGRLHRLMDWTQGCIALTNSEIKEVYDFVPIGTEIQINP